MKHFIVGQNAQVIAYVSQNRFYKVVNFAGNVLSKTTSEELADDEAAERALADFDDAQAFDFAERFGNVILEGQPEGVDIETDKVPVTGGATPVSTFPPEMGLGVLAMQAMTKNEPEATSAEAKKK